ncbi:MAG: response regulator, partial [Natronospirillum sp.]
MIFSSQSMSILVVEDIATMRKMLKDSLHMMGLNNVLMAENGEQALTLLDANRVDLIISDYNMPRMDGMELLKFIRKNPAWRSIPYMMVTGESDRAMVSEAIQEGVTQFLIKPFTYADLQFRVHKITAQLKHHGPLDIAAPLVENYESPLEFFGHDLGNTAVLLVGSLASNKPVVSALKRFHRLRSVTTASHALATLHAQPIPDLILMDISLPDRSGYAVCRQLKNDPTTAAIPVIFLSTQEKADEITRGFNAGCVDYITQPADPRVLQARVATHIQIRQAKEDLRSHVDTLLENARL